MNHSKGIGFVFNFIYNLPMPVIPLCVALRIELMCALNNSRPFLFHLLFWRKVSISYSGGTQIYNPLASASLNVGDYKHMSLCFCLLLLFRKYMFSNTYERNEKITLNWEQQTFDKIVGNFFLVFYLPILSKSKINVVQLQK